MGDYFRRPQIGIAVWSLALVLGMVQSSYLFHVWPSSGPFVSTFARYLQPNAHYLVEVPEVPIYYLMGNKDAQPEQFTSTFVIVYINKKGQTLTGPAGFTAAVQDGYFQVIAYNNTVTQAVDGSLAKALNASHAYYLAAKVNLSDSLGPVDLLHLGQGPQADRDASRQEVLSRARPDAQFLNTFTYWTTMVPCDEVWASGRGAPALGIGEDAADRDVEQDREAVVDGRGPGRLPDPGLAHAVELVSVQVPADLLVTGVAPVDDHGVGVEALQASGAVLQAAAQAGSSRGTARSSRRDCAPCRFPQCRVPEVLLSPLTFSMMSISPVVGHPVGGSIQNPGQ